MKMLPGSQPTYTIGIHESALTMEFTLVEFADVLDAVGERELTFSLLPTVIRLSLIG